MKTIAVLLFALLPGSVLAQGSPTEGLPLIASKKYSWKTPTEKVKKDLRTAVILEGGAHDMEVLRVLARSLQPSGRKTELQVPRNEEHLIIVKSGRLSVTFHDSTWHLGPGSVALLVPGTSYRIQNEGDVENTHYLMQYRARSLEARHNPASRSFVRDWNTLSYRKHDRGGVRNYFNRATVMSRRFEMHVTTLNPGLKSHEPHTHRAEEIILMLEDENGSKAQTEMLIGDQYFKAQAGDLYYVATGLLHGIRNEGNAPCTYFAFQFE